MHMKLSLGVFMAKKRVRVLLLTAFCAAFLLAVAHTLTLIGASEKTKNKQHMEQSFRNDSIIALALTEEPVLRRRSSPRLEEPPPANLTTAERTAWFKDNIPRFKFLHHDSISAPFATRATEFFNSSACSQRFFMTWISHYRSFGGRERLAMESLFRWNSDACLLILSRSLDSPAGNRILEPFLRRGFKVTAMAPDLRYLAQGTPVEDWFRRVQESGLDPGTIPFAQNLSNILRLLVLFRFGGIYLDTDIIVLRDMSRLGNVIGAQSADAKSGRWTRLNNAVMAMERGHSLLILFMEEFDRSFDGSKWGHNGPYLLSRVVSAALNSSDSASVLADVLILSPSAFYPVDWIRIRDFFSAAVSAKWRLETLLWVEERSYALHLWNKQTRSLNVERGSIIHLLLYRHCIFCEGFYNGSSASSTDMVIHQDERKS